MDSLIDIVNKAQAGDVNAYGELVRRFQDMAFGYAFGILGDAHLGYLKRGSVIPECRGKGVFKAMVSKRLDVLRARGISTALILAKSDTSAPRCERFGFETVSRVQYFFEQG